MTDRASNRLVRRGACHVLGDDVPLDEVIPHRFAAARVTDPALLTPHLFESIDAGFAQRVKPGDIVLAGRNFACGKPRVQGFIAMAALNLGVVCASTPYRMLRRAVAHAIPILSGGPQPASIATTGDEIEVDFARGVIRNLSRNTQTTAPEMPPILREVVAGGGARAALAEWLAQHPEQALQTK